MRSVKSTILDLNGGWDKDIESVSLVERFPVSLNVAEIGSRVVRSHLQDLQARVHLEGSSFTLKVKIIVKNLNMIIKIHINIFFSAITKDILGSFLMTVRPAEIILPSFFQINVLHILGMIRMILVMMTIMMVMRMMMMIMVIMGMLMIMVVVTFLQDSLQHILAIPCPPPQP